MMNKYEKQTSSGAGLPVDCDFLMIYNNGYSLTAGACLPRTKPLESQALRLVNQNRFPGNS